MNKLTVKPKLDLIFKKLFAETKTKNYQFLRVLISEALEVPFDSIQVVTVENSELLPDKLGDKFCRLDIYASVDGRKVDIEIQVSDYGAFRERALYYWAEMFKNSLSSGKDYSMLPETIVICIIDFNLFPCSEYCSSYFLKEKTRNDILSNKIAFHFFELKKVPAKFHNKSKRIENWLRLIKAETYEELEVLEQTDDEELKQAVDKIKIMNADKTLRQQAEDRETTLREEQSALSIAKNQGIIEGKIEAQEELIEAMRKSGLNEKQIKAVLENTK